MSSLTPSRMAGSSYHDGCGAEVRSVVRCAAGHDVDEPDVVVRVARSSR